MAYYRTIILVEVIHGEDIQALITNDELPLSGLLEHMKESDTTFFDHTPGPSEILTTHAAVAHIADMGFVAPEAIREFLSADGVRNWLAVAAKGQRNDHECVIRVRRLERLYDEGHYKFDPPGGCHDGWDKAAWISYIDSGGGIWVEGS